MGSTWAEDDWERTVPPVEVARDDVDTLLGDLGPCAQVHLLTGGKANTNLRIERHDRPPLVVRLHQRDPSSLQREAALRALVGSRAPVPTCLAQGRLRGHPASVHPFVQGVPPAVALHEQPHDAMTIGAALAVPLAALATTPIDGIGLYAPDLTLARRFDSMADSFDDLVRWSVTRGRARKRLGPDRTRALLAALPAACARLGPLEAHPALAHGDYKSSNLLLAPDPWRVVAVLDWEFACPFTQLLDVAILFRHRDDWPTELQSGFADCFRDAGGWLPDDWREVSRILDLMNLVGFLNASGDRPRLFDYVRARIDATLGLLRT